MLTGELRSQVDAIWNAFWSGGISNPMEVLEQITYLLFIRRLDDAHTLEESEAITLGKPIESRVFPAGTDAKGRGAVHRRSLDELLARLNQSAVARPVAGHDVITWSELTSRRLGDKGAIQAVMGAASEGALLPTRRGRLLGHVQFLRDEVMRFFGTPKLESGMSVQQLALATGWKWESIAHWIDSGLLQSTSIRLRGQPCRVVSPEQLLHFRQGFLPLADLARAMATTSTALLDQLPGLTVVGAKPLPGGARRGGLLRIAELGRLAMHRFNGRSPLRREVRVLSD